MDRESCRCSTGACPNLAQGQLGEQPWGSPSYSCALIHLWTHNNPVQQGDHIGDRQTQIQHNETQENTREHMQSKLMSSTEQSNLMGRNAWCTTSTMWRAARHTGLGRFLPRCHRSTCRCRGRARWAAIFLAGSSPCHSASPISSCSAAVVRIDGQCAAQAPCSTCIPKPMLSR